MKFNFNNDKCPIWGTGFFHRLEMLACIVERWKINPEVYFYDKEGKNRWNEIFTHSLDDSYSKTKSLKVLPENRGFEVVDEHIHMETTENSIDFLSVYGENITREDGSICSIGPHLINTRPRLNRFRFTVDFLNKINEKYEELGRPTVGLFLRESDKFDGILGTLHHTPISSRMIYDRLRELGLDKEKILVVSDSFLSTNYLLDKGLDIVYVQKYKTETLFPNFIWSKISRFYEFNSGEHNLFTDHEFEMGYEFLLEMGMMLKINPGNVFQNILHGPSQFYFYLNGDHQVRELIDLDRISIREKEIVTYHQKREGILWRTLYGVLGDTLPDERF